MTTGPLPTNPDPPPKRRKIRKGTTSCWECKRRKVRCLYDADQAACRECRQKESVCVGQDHPEDGATQQVLPVPTATDAPDRSIRMEKLMEQVIVSVDTFLAEHNCRPVPSQAPVDPRISAIKKLSDIRHKLLKALPSPDDAFKIYELGHSRIFFHQILFTPHDGLETHLKQTAVEATEALLFETHPAVLAKNMLIMAIQLQRASREPASVACLSEPHQAIMTRLFDAATTLVCADDSLMCTIEALHCLILHSVYLCNSGNLRLALLACRRAMTMAQLMGLHRPRGDWNVESVGPTEKMHPRTTWFRMHYVEHFLCLLLGVPPSHRPVATSLSPDADVHPLEQLEQRQVAAAYRIMERNEHDTEFQDRQTLLSIEEDLKTAAAAMSPDWWEVPTFSNVSHSPAAVLWETLRAADQLFQYFLYVQLYLPFMLRGRRETTSVSDSKLKCLDASREVLVRYVALRKCSGSSGGMPDTTDFFALVAAMAVMLAHIDTHKVRPGDGHLASLRPRDRDLVEDALLRMGRSCSMSKDVLSVQGADVLRKLLEIDANVAVGLTYSTTAGKDDIGQPAGGVDTFRLKIPYFGVVVISPDVVVSREPIKVTAPARWEQTGTGSMVDLLAGEMTGQGLPDDFQEFYPGYSARAEDWSMQGVDATFFDSLTRGLGD
ncbi:hypothetical protein F5X68DRAFT_255380 [Plectosphaerella plurivora]|uniref:Zn(2)-C6 fungal-type domain-containing protein n=1 Tax=Plectosphaerella plurivora TaxID=936078 RepID=A0A9P8VCF5_9PEZI|nr:hypothetical protein F5X68DRAFT_255380 [Plectosphaerella plurivora]